MRHEAANELALPGGVRIPRLVKHHARGEKVIMLESELLMIEEVDRANQLATPNEQKYSERDLATDEHHAQTIVCPAWRPATCFALQVGVDGGSRGPQRGRHAR